MVKEVVGGFHLATNAAWYSAHSSSYVTSDASTPICRVPTAILSTQFCSGMINTLHMEFLVVCGPVQSILTSFIYQDSEEALATQKNLPFKKPVSKVCLRHWVSLAQDIHSVPGTSHSQFVTVAASNTSSINHSSPLLIRQKYKPKDLTCQTGYSSSYLNLLSFIHQEETHNFLSHLPSPGLLIHLLLFLLLDFASMVHSDRVLPPVPPGMCSLLTLHAEVDFAHLAPHRCYLS